MVDLSSLKQWSGDLILCEKSLFIQLIIIISLNIIILNIKILSLNFFPQNYMVPL